MTLQDQIAAVQMALHAEHTRLTQAFVEAQQVAENAWAEYEARSAELTTFRETHGAALKALALPPDAGGPPPADS